MVTSDPNVAKLTIVAEARYSIPFHLNRPMIVRSFCLNNPDALGCIQPEDQVVSRRPFQDHRMRVCSCDHDQPDNGGCCSGGN